MLTRVGCSVVATLLITFLQSLSFPLLVEGRQCEREPSQAKASHHQVRFAFAAWMRVHVWRNQGTIFERLHIDQIIESQTMLLYFKNNKTWQVMGARHDLIALGIN